MATRAEVFALQAAAMDEAELQRKVEKAARDAGWRVWHPKIAVYSQNGWPDLVCAHPGQRRVLYRELKTERGKVTAQQQEWLDTLTVCGMDAAVWRPIDWVNGTITRELAGQRPERLCRGAESRTASMHIPGCASEPLETVECPTSRRVDRPGDHSWRFMGDDPYIKCSWCGEIRDAVTGRILRAGDK